MRKIKKFPEKIELALKNKLGSKVILPLVIKREEQKLSGLSQKTCYENPETGAVYFVKSQKPRKILDIVGTDYPESIKLAFTNNSKIAKKHGIILDEYTGRYTSIGSDDKYLSTMEIDTIIDSMDESEKLEFLSNNALIEKAAAHVKDVLLERTFLEALSPQIIKAIMGDSIFVPENYLYVDDEGEAFILSQSIFKSPKELEKCKDEKHVVSFKEFLSDKGVIGEKSKPEDWQHHQPLSIDKFNLTVKQADILGQLYFLALLIGHWDLFNNIDLSNSGSVMFSDGSTFPAIVDHGNNLGTGFSGLTQAETFRRNPDKDPLFQDFKTETNFLKQITGFQFTDIYDSYVAQLQLPRSLVADLFDLTEKSSSSERAAIRKAQIEGFTKACLCATDNAGYKNRNLLMNVPKAVNDLMRYYMSDKDAKLIRSAVNSEMYHLSDKPASPFTYNLANILAGRLVSLRVLPEEMTKKSVQEISRSRFRFLMNSQLTLTEIAESKETPHL